MEGYVEEKVRKKRAERADVANVLGNRKMHIRKRLQEALRNEMEQLQLTGKEIYVDDSRDPLMTYKITYGEMQTVKGLFTYEPEIDRIDCAVLKQSMLNKTFRELELPMKASIELSESYDASIFMIQLDEGCFGCEETEKMLDYMFDFLKLVVVFSNTETC